MIHEDTNTSGDSDTSNEVANIQRCTISKRPLRHGHVFIFCPRFETFTTSPDTLTEHGTTRGSGDPYNGAERGGKIRVGHQSVSGGETMVYLRTQAFHWQGGIPALKFAAIAWLSVATLPCCRVLVRRSERRESSRINPPAGQSLGTPAPVAHPHHVTRTGITRDYLHGRGCAPLIEGFHASTGESQFREN